MERLTINIPDKNSHEVKDYLKTMGVDFEASKNFDRDAYRKVLLGIGQWSANDVKGIHDGRAEFDSFKPQSW